MGKIDTIEEKDVEEVRELLRVTWIDTYGGIMPARVIEKVTSTWHSRESILRGINDPKVYFAGYRGEIDGSGKILGIVTVGEIGEGAVQIYRLYVLPSFQKKGIGSKLLSSALEHFAGIKRFVADVEEENHGAVSFYKKKGFKQIGRKDEKIEGVKIQTLVFELSVA